MNPFKNGHIYKYVEYPTYIRLHMVIWMKFKAMKDVSDADAQNRYDYISILQHNINFLQSKQKMHDMVTYHRTFLNHGQKVRHHTRIKP